MAPAARIRSSRCLLLVLCVALTAPIACDHAAAPPSTGPESRRADPNAENPDRDRFVDLASTPFRPEWVGGTVVQVRSALAQSLNAAVRAGRSLDVERLHKFLLNAPLLMERPDKDALGRFPVVPHAAAAMPDVAPDGLSQVWTLRDDLTWEDGRPVTAADYAFTFAMIVNPDVESAIADSFRNVAGFDVLDARRFRVRFSKPHYRAVETIGLDLQVVPAHAMPKDGVAFRKTTTHLSCGPYRVASFEPATRIELVLRDEYRRRPFPIRPHYVARYVYEGGARDPVATFVRLVNGDVHVAGLTGDQFARDATADAFKAAAWRTHYYLPAYSFIAWNLRDPSDRSRPHPVLGDVRVRRALAHLVPLEAIAATTYHGLARRISGPFDFRDPGADPDISPVAFDPAAAARLLFEAGFRAGGDGVLARDGRPCRFTLARAGGLFSAMAQAFQEEARKAGVAIDLEDRPTLFSDDLPRRAFDAAIVYWQLDAVEPDLTAQFHSRFAASGGANYSGLSDPAVDALLDSIESCQEPAERQALRRRLHGAIVAASPSAFLLAHATTAGISRRVANAWIHDLGLRFHDLVVRDVFR